MGLLQVEVEILKAQDGPSRRLALLVDTGASLSVIPREVLESLGIRPEDQEAFELADGRIMIRAVGPAVVRFRGKAAGTQVIFGEPEDEPVLGVTTLEELGLQVDTRTGRLEKARRLLVPVRAAEA